MGYDITYRIINNDNGEVIFLNSNINCFAEFTTTGVTSAALIFSKNKSIQVHRKLSTISLSRSNLNKYLKLLNKSGFVVTTKIIQPKEINDLSVYTKHFNFLDGPFIEFTLNFNDYKTKQHLKLALYLVRFIFEVQAYELIEDSLKFIDSNPECPILEAIRITAGYSDKFYKTGHTIFSDGIRTSPITKEIFNKIFVDKEYDNTELSTLVTFLRRFKQVGNLTKDSSYKEHLEHFKVKLDEI